MALSGPDNWGVFRKRKPWGGLMGGYLGDRNRRPQPNARFRQNPFPSMASDPTWGVASTFPAKTPNTPIAGKKGFFGKMSPEELKDFKETMAEMDFGVDQEFLTGVSPSPPPPGSFKPMAFDQTAELKKRREQMQSLFPFLTA